MEREARFCAERSKNQIDMVFMPQGLHEEPQELRSEVQKAIDKSCVEKPQDYDALLLGYGLCSNGIVGLNSKIQLVVPRGHDCVTILIGSKDKYQQYFESHKGVYWYSSGWIAAGKQPGKNRYEQTLKGYEEKYGTDNASYLMEAEQRWMTEYNWATYIDWGFADSQAEKEYTRKCAEFMGWKYDELKGDPSLLQRLFDGQWASGEFLIVKPGRKITEDLTCDGIIKAQ